MEHLSLVPRDPHDPIAREPSICIEELRAVARRTAEYVLSTTRTDRADRLWPADYTVFLSNPLSLAYGACGTALFLDETLGGLPPDIERWLLNRNPDTDRYPPGLYMGLAGVAYAFARLGHEERAMEVMDRAYCSPLLYADASVFQGVAGWGLASLELYASTGVGRFLDRACEAADHLLRSSEVDGQGRCWRDPADGTVHHGLAYGASGIGLFLLHLYSATGDERYRAGAVEAISFEIAGVRVIGDTLRWGANADDTMTEPYWLHGTSGVGSALIRFHTILGDDRFRGLAERAADGAFSLFTVEPNQFRGMAGIGEFMLDLFLATGQPQYLRRAHRIAESILCYRIERPEGIAFPGRFLIRITSDFGTGSAGVGMFLNRVAGRGARMLHDRSEGLAAPAAAHKPEIALLTV